MLESPDVTSFAFADLLGQSAWSAYVPTRSGWADVGTPTVSARFHRVGRLMFFQVEVAPSTSCATTAGTSYVTLPVPARGYGGVAVMTDMATNVAVGTCVIDITNSRCYVPTQAATTNKLTTSGWYEI